MVKGLKRKNMLKYIYITISFIFLSHLALAQSPLFPNPYEGLWEGELKMYRPINIKEPERDIVRPKVTTQLEITKNDSAHCWNFTIRYISQGNKEERKYLLKKDSLSGSYIIEEINGVKLYSYLLGTTLIERFSLPEKDIVSIYKFSADTVFTQIISSEVAPITWTGGSKGVPKIFSYFVDGYQDAFLIRKKR